MPDRPAQQSDRDGETFFGAWLRRRRRALDLTQDQLANQVGCAADTVRKLEAGMRRPSRAMAERLALCLSVPPDQRDAFLAAARVGFAPPDNEVPTRTATTIAMPVAVPASGATPLSPIGYLPAPVTSFIGREWEVATVGARLRTPDVRLLTLTGVGGIGKTRLALQIAGALHDMFAHGIWFVDLAPISDPKLVLSTIAQALGVREQLGMSSVETLRAALREQQLLVLLDNCEQVVTAAPELGQLLAGVAGLKLLVTSREALRLSGEHVVVVAPLAVPTTDDRRPTTDDRRPTTQNAQALVVADQSSVVMQYAAAQLFVARAQMASEQFRLTDANAAAVAAICARLDGLPLAIELAAAWVPLFAPAALLARLEQRLPMLMRGPRDVAARQQTLRNTITWSYDLLTESEQMLFRRLGVFVGGCTLEAAERVLEEGLRTEGRGLSEDALNSALSPRPSVPDNLVALVGKSLLRQIAGPGGEPRFTMLETVREYALEQLDMAGEATRLSERHAVYYLALAEQAEPHLRGRQQAAWLSYLDQEYDNVRLALQWSLDLAHTEVAARLSAALWRFWDLRAHLSEGQKWLEQILARCGNTPTVQRAEALIGLGVMEMRRDNYPRALTMLEISLALFRELQNKRGIASALSYLGLLTHLRGDDLAARSILEESVTLFKELEDYWSLSNSLNSLGAIAQHHSHNDQALALFEQSLALQRVHSEDKQNLSYTLNALGWAAHTMGHDLRADALLDEGLRLRRELGDKRGIAISLNNIGAVAQDRGDNIRAKPFFVESLALFHDLRNNWYIAHCLQQLAAVMITEERPQRAAHLCAAAQALRETIHAPLWPSARAHYERIVSTAREQLGQAAFATIWEAGRTTSLDNSINYALQA